MRRVAIPRDGGDHVLEVDVNLALSDESGATVWDSALCLGEMLIKRQITCGERVLELGSGTGYCGLVAAALGHKVTLTDRPVMLPLLESNIASNKLEEIRADVQELQWGQAPGIEGIETVIMSDCVYLPELSPLLLSTLDAMEGPLTVLWANEVRGVEEEFQEMLLRSGWSLQQLVIPEGNDYACEEIRMAMAGGSAIALDKAEGPWASSAACSAQGPRPQNEDVHVMICNGLPEGPAPNIKAAGLPGLFDDLPELVSGPSLPADLRCDCLFAVFDGHGGAAAARACAERIPTEIREELDASGRDSPEARRSAVQGTYLAARRETDGRTDGGYILGYEVAGETKDHTPSAPEEEKRIKAAGGKVETFPGSRVPVLRVDGFLGCSRALGDFRFKEDAALLPEQQKVSAVPEVYESRNLPVLGVAMLVTGASGSNGSTCEAAARSIVKAALADPRQQDNVTCVRLDRPCNLCLVRYLGRSYLMAPHDKGCLDDVQVLGAWNFTLQADTPLYWLRCGRLDKYLMKFTVHAPCPCTCGIVLHAEADFGGTDGASFWVERRKSEDGQGTKRYLLSGDGLDSRPIVTKQYPDSDSDSKEEIEVLMQGLARAGGDGRFWGVVSGYNGVIMVQNRKVHLKFKCRRNKGSIAFYNSTQSDRDDVHFADVRITAIQRGPMEVAGWLGQRERQLLGRDREDPTTTVQDEDNVGLRPEDPDPARSTSTSRMSRTQKQATLLRSGVGPVKKRPNGPLHQSGNVLRRSASDVVLPKSNTRSTRWIPLAKNAPASEKQLIRDRR
eukprot:g26222.t2